MPCRAVFRAGRAGGDEISELVAPALDKVEEALGRFSDGPFFLGQSRSAVSNQSIIHSIVSMPEPDLIGLLMISAS
jgi:hypothetical protein